MRFEGSSSALAGIVQAVLLTRHILFVGYSLRRAVADALRPFEGQESR